MNISSYEYQVYVKWRNGETDERLYKDHEQRICLRDYESFHADSAVEYVTLRRRAVGTWELQSMRRNSQAA